MSRYFDTKLNIIDDEIKALLERSKEVCREPISLDELDESTTCLEMASSLMTLKNKIAFKMMRYELKEKLRTLVLKVKLRFR